MSKVLRFVNFTSAAGAEIRVAEFQGRKHLIVPVTALVEGVLQGINSPTPEFVPAHVIHHAPSGWNGRPVVCDHPVRNDEMVSANNPEVLEAEQFGFLFNSRAENGELLSEAWLDPDRAKLVGEKAVKICERVERKESIEISIGAFVGVLNKGGIFRGQKYGAEWESAIPDHFAMLSEGSIGACSNAMGCGIRSYVATVRTPVTETPVAKSLRERIAEFLTALTAEEKPEELDAALSNDPGDEDDGDDPAALRTECSRHNKEGVTDMTKKERVKALITSTKNAFTEADATFLEGLADDRLAQFESAEKPAEVPAKPEEKPAEKPAPVLTPEQQEEAYLQSAPQSIRDMVGRQKAADASRKTALVTALTSKVNGAYSEDELKGMSIEQLEKLATITASQTPERDFSGVAFGRRLTAADEKIPAPIGLVRTLQEKNKTKAS